jgi:hypothetical protein
MGLCWLGFVVGVGEVLDGRKERMREGGEASSIG